MPDNAIRIHANTLEKMQYSVKTHFGISEGKYLGDSSIEPLFGTGQGSGASPAAWLSLVVLIMNTMDTAINERVHFQSPGNAEKHTRLIDAFVDDTSLSFTTDEDITIHDMVRKLTHIATCWNKLLHFTGGSLNLQKCAYHISMWEWHNGRPQIRNPKHDDPAVRIKSLSTGHSETIKNQSYRQASRLLGVHIAPSGDYTQQIKILKHKADSYASSIQSPRLKPADIVTFLRTTYAPAMGYVLPCLAVDEEELHQVPDQTTGSGTSEIWNVKQNTSSHTTWSKRHGRISTIRHPNGNGHRTAQNH
jgi:hypothetical protein